MRPIILIVLGLVFLHARPAQGYSLLSHEAIIDTTWKQAILPLLRQKYPGATEEELKEARAYVYGGAVIPDIGYYPFGSVMFSQLLHYVRTGDFVSTLISEAHTLNELAFALGALCHYNADRYGHPLGTNLAVPIMFPKLRKKYGDTVTFDQARKKHIRAEFGFDVLQTAKGNYEPKAYHDFVGFKISEEVLSRAFLKTYGLELNEVFGSLPVAMATFRYAVKELLPELTEDAWKARSSVISKMNPLADKKSYTYKIKRKDYRRDFGRTNLKTVLFSSIVGLLPKIGPTESLKFKEPTDRSEEVYNRSFMRIVQEYTASLASLNDKVQALDNINFDTGKGTIRGDYQSADEGYRKWLMKLKRKKFAHINPALKEHLIHFYSTTSEDKRQMKRPGRKKKTDRAISLLNAT